MVPCFWGPRLYVEMYVGVGMIFDFPFSPVNKLRNTPPPRRYYVATRAQTGPRISHGLLLDGN
jgi:hypothetical protein